jgi:hypothetical protein
MTVPVSASTNSLDWSGLGYDNAYHVYGVCVSIRNVLDWMIGFVDILYIQLVTKNNYSAIAISMFYNSLLHTLVYSVFTNRILATDS